MTENDRDAEIGRTIREYKEQSERLGCLFSKLNRISSQIEQIQGAADNPEQLIKAAVHAADQIGECDVSKLFQDISETSRVKDQLVQLLQRQGLGDLISGK